MAVAPPVHEGFLETTRQLVAPLDVPEEAT
jgi:hypothetical protein